ncbi:MAG: murein biosynthesis integral membrane protein MurJ [Candidatus Falkowbacteria bacterium]|nr:murein biosynthesis integral membrane protein MurJ [Candidatus Falkowbacteria bacterium]
MSRNPFSRFFNSSPGASVASAAFVIGLMSIASRFLGIFRDRILASSFGASQTLDIYYAAFRLPDLVFNLLVLGALSAGFIPVFARLIKDNKDHEVAWKLASNILNTLTVGLLVVCGVAVLIAPWLVNVIAPGFPIEARSTIVTLTRIMFLSPIFLGLSSIAGGMLQSFSKFFVYSLSPILYNIGIICGALFLVPYFGIMGLAWGVVIGSFCHFLVQLPALFQLGFRYHFFIDWKDKSMRAIYRMMTARTLGLAITQINLTVITIIASGLPAGSLSVFNLANNLQSFPVSIFGISFAIAVFPLLSATTTDKDFTDRFSRTFRQIMFFIVPATVAFIVLRAQIVRVILGSGQFNWHDTTLTIDTLGFFVLSLFAQATIPLLTRGFYARHDSKTPFFIGLFSDAMNVFLALWLIKILGVAGLALSFSLSVILNFLLLFFVLHHRLGSLDDKKIVVSIAKFSAAALAMGLSVQAMKLLVWPYVDMTKLWGVLSQGALAGLFGLVVYLAVCSLLKSEEFFELWAATKVRILDSIKKVKNDDQGEVRGI